MYFIVFRFYRFLSDLYPDARRNAAIAVLFVPSVLFWSSGILKDSFSFTFALLSTVSLYHLIIKPQKILRYLLYLIFSAYIVLSIKPYIFFALFVAALVWLLLVQSKRIKNVFLKVVGVPAVSFLIIAGGIFAINQLGSFVGSYYTDIDKVAAQAVVIQDDLSPRYVRRK
jgi:4-amino-4-deoxy-L-arabinose transferase-like glycosyltransferase